MRTSLVFVALGLVAVLAGPALAQERQRETDLSGQERMLRALLLPRTTHEARQAGIAEEELRKVLRAGRDRRIPPDEMELVLREEVRAMEDHGPIDNFGAFVQQRLDQGLRGRELAAAIRAEHTAHGKGGPAGKAKSKGKEGHR